MVFEVRLAVPVGVIMHRRRQGEILAVLVIFYVLIWGWLHTCVHSKKVHQALHSWFVYSPMGVLYAC